MNQRALRIALWERDERGVDAGHGVIVHLPLRQSEDRRGRAVGFWHVADRAGEARIMTCDVRPLCAGEQRASPLGEGLLHVDAHLISNVVAGAADY